MKVIYIRSKLSWETSKPNWPFFVFFLFVVCVIESLKTITYSPERCDLIDRYLISGFCPNRLIYRITFYSLECVYLHSVLCIPLPTQDLGCFALVCASVIALWRPVIGVSSRVEY